MKNSVGAFPPQGSVVAVNGCPTAAALSFSVSGKQSVAFHAVKCAGQASVALGIVGGTGSPHTASVAGRAMMQGAKDMLRETVGVRIEGMHQLYASDTGFAAPAMFPCLRIPANWPYNRLQPHPNCEMYVLMASKPFLVALCRTEHVQREHLSASSPPAWSLSAMS